MDLKDVGKRIRQKRLEKSWRQEDLAEKANLSTSYVGMIERGEKCPSLETFIIIANTLDVSADVLLSGVLQNGYEIRMSEYIKKIGSLTKEKQRAVYNVLDVLIQNMK